MKHSVTLKFIAVFLCALSLLGAVASAGSIAVLTEMDLYNKTVEQVLQDQIPDEAQQIAWRAAMGYASTNLGGCPEELLRDQYGYMMASGVYRDYGYAILDAEGSVLSSLNTELKDTGACYTLPVEGQYMHLVTEMPSSEKYPDPVDAEEMYSGPLEGRLGVFDAVPTDGEMVHVYNITLGYSDDSGEGFGSVDPIGLIYHDGNGRVVFLANQSVFLDTGEDRGAITYISFRAENDTILYEAASESAVGTVYYQDGLAVFESGEAQTLDISGFAEVYHVQFYSSAEPSRVVFELKDTAPLGFMEYAEDGTLHVVIHNLQDMKVMGEGEVGFPVSRVSLFDADGRILKDYTGPGGVAMSEDYTCLHYNSTLPVVSAAAVAASQAAETAPIPEETLEETAPETVPETIPETEEETTAETVVETIEEEPVPEAEDPIEESAPEKAVPETAAAADNNAEAARMLTEEPTEPVLINGKELWEYGINNTTYYSADRGETMYAEYVYVPMPDYRVEVYLSESYGEEEAAYTILGFIRTFRNDLFLYLGVSLLIFAIAAVYLCASAGHQPKTDEIHARGLNCLPLDLYLLGGGLLIAGLAVMGVEGGEYMLRKSILSGCGLAISAAFLACLTVVGFCFAFVAQAKTPGGYWWRNTCVVRFFVLWFRLLAWLQKWLEGTFFPWLGRTIRSLWRFTVRVIRALWRFGTRSILALRRFTGAFFKGIGAFLGGSIRRFVALLPMTWQWMVAGFLLIFVITLVTAAGNVLLMLIGMALAVCIVLYVSHCFGTLMESAKRMSKGDLDSKVDDKLMVGCFQEFAGDLNDLADVAVVAAQKQLKSERMKTELITNVSHDIKTPLTSIINYVDLLQKPHTEAEGDVYLEVLERQSQRLKKLIEDLMDMSKASTGNMAVDLTELDAVECVNQALGEFGDKLERAQLLPVFRHGDESAMMVGDGRLVWRVLSNILGNAVKYAMPGTRLYIDLMTLEGKVVISLKNISRDELNVDAEELMERFVRGDDSRNTEGSGLGLNIAKSLMELQKGQLQLLVDGDLFKVTLIFPGA